MPGAKAARNGTFGAGKWCNVTEEWAIVCLHRAAYFAYFLHSLGRGHVAPQSPKRTIYGLISIARRPSPSRGDQAVRQTPPLLPGVWRGER